LARLVEMDQLLRLQLIGPVAAVAEIGDQRLLEDVEIAVLAEYHGHYHPIIGGAYTAVGTVIAVEGPAGKGAGVGFFPIRSPFADREVIGGMFHIGSADETALFYGAQGLAHQYPVHDDRVSRSEIGGRELMFGLYDLLHR